MSFNFLIDDYDNLTVLPLEIKPGKDYTVHSALDNFLNTPLYNIHRAIVFSNEGRVYEKEGVVYMPIYYCMFLQHPDEVNEEVILPELEPLL